MSQRLFVDCDGTLLLYPAEGEHQLGAYDGLQWTPNHALIQGIKDYVKKHPDALVVVWSGGGRRYAQICQRMVGLGDIAAAMVKSGATINLVRPGDIVVDDQELGGVRTHKPDEWPET